MESLADKVDRRGAVVLPAKLRRRLDLGEGSFVVAEERLERRRGSRASAASDLFRGAVAVEDVIGRFLSLRCCGHHHSLVASEFCKPPLNIRGLVLKNRRRDAGFGAQISGRKFRHQLLERIRGRAERRGFRDRFPV